MKPAAHGCKQNQVFAGKAARVLTCSLARQTVSGMASCARIRPHVRSAPNKCRFWHAHILPQRAHVRHWGFAEAAIGRVGKSTALTTDWLSCIQPRMNTDWHGLSAVA